MKSSAITFRCFIRRMSAPRKFPQGRWRSRQRPANTRRKAGASARMAALFGRVSSSTRSSPLRTNFLGFAKITRDLTERRAADERARQAQKMEGIGQLTGGVAHDFNNLLTIIIGNLETLQRNLDAVPLPVERLKRSAENAMRGSRRAESLTQRLLAFSRQTPLDSQADRYRPACRGTVRFASAYIGRTDHGRNRARRRNVARQC